MLKSYTLLLLLQFTILTAFAAKPPLPQFEMGKSKETYEADGLKDISNPESWEETKFEYGQPIVLFGINATKTELVFYNKRLYEVIVTLPLDSWETVKANLDKEYGAAWTIDTSKTEKSGQWGEVYSGVSVYQINGIGTVVTYTDAAQKEFHFSDLFHGMLLWIIVTIVGLFVFNWMIAWLLTSYCKRCKTFNMKLAGRELGDAKDYNTDILGSPDLHRSTTYKYKCSKCGHTRKDKYSGFISYMRSKD